MPTRGPTITSRVSAAGASRTSRHRLPNRTRGGCQNAWRPAPVSRSRITGSTFSVVAGSARRRGAPGRADVVRRRMPVLAPRILPRGERTGGMVTKRDAERPKGLTLGHEHSESAGKERVEMPEKEPFDKKDATASVSESENPAIPSPTPQADPAQDEQGLVAESAGPFDSPRRTLPCPIRWARTSTTRRSSRTSTSKR